MAIFDRYPTITNKTLQGVLDALAFIARLRLKDIDYIQNLPNIYIGGRKVPKIPSSSTDITNPTSAVGDFNVTKDFAYFCIDTGVAIEWRRVAVGSF